MTTAKQTSAAAYWTLDGSRSRLSVGALSGVIDVERPDLGLSELQLDGAMLPGYLLGVGVESASAKPRAANAQWQPSDCYARGRDLVATYREPFGEPFNLQVYWRVVEACDDQPQLDAIVSIQTPQWEAYPGVTVSSSLKMEGAKTMHDARIMRVTPELSYVEATRPGDFALVDDGQGACWRFGDQFMERGVIRRLQLRAAFCSSGDDATCARRLQESLLAEAPPLTA